MHRRVADDVPPAPLLITTSYDWVGDTVHLTGPCDPDQPHRLTDATTPPATTADMAMPGQIPQQVAARGLLPADHPVDAGSVCAENLVERRQDGVDVIGPTQPAPGWRAPAGAGVAGHTHQVKEAPCVYDVVTRPINHERSFPCRAYHRL